MQLDNIKTKIKEDIKEVFNDIRKDIYGYFKQDTNVSLLRNHLKNIVPTIIKSKINILYDTLLNYLVNEANSTLNSEDYMIQLDFNSKSFEIRKKINEALKLHSDELKLSTDPRYIYGGITGGGTFIVGSAFTVLIPGGLFIKSITGLATIALSIVAFKMGFDKSSGISIKKLKEDLEKFLIETEQQFYIWIEDVIKAFNEEFLEFCKEKRINYE